MSILNSQAVDQWMVASAQRSYYEQLITAGVEIHLYKKPQLVHEKFMVIDKETAIVGSSNMDIRSFELNHECSVVLYDTRAAKELAKHHESLITHSQLLKLEEWGKRGYWKQLLESIARLSSALQ